MKLRLINFVSISIPGTKNGREKKASNTLTSAYKRRYKHIANTKPLRPNFLNKQKTSEKGKNHDDRQRKSME